MYGTEGVQAMVERSAFLIIVMAASAGGVEALGQILAALSPELAAAVFIVQHIGDRASALPDILGRTCALPVAHALEGQPIQPGHVYIAPPGHHMVLTPDRIHLNRGPREHYTRPAANPLFRSAAEAYGDRVIGVVLTGGDEDGGQGMQAIHHCGGLGIVQDPGDAAVPGMPESALDQDHPSHSVPVAQIGPLLNRLVQGRLV